MSYRLDMGPYSGVFAVPHELVDRHIKLAGPSAVKVILVLLRHSGQSFDEGQLLELTGIPLTEVTDALEYWIQAGVLQKDGAAPVDFDLQKTEIPAPAPAVKAELPGYVNDKGCRIVTTSPPRLERREVASRINAEPKLKFLLDEAELKLGRNLTHTDAASLISLHDWAGMQWDVLMMLIVHCALTQKNTVRHIEREAMRWVDAGIDTMEKAERYIVESDRQDKAERTVRSLFGIRDRVLSAKEKDYIKNWILERKVDPDVLKAAYDRCIDSVGALRFSYINSIIEAWCQKGIKSVRDIEQKDGKKQGKTSPKTSIDMDLVENNYLHVIPKYQRRKG